MDTDVQSKRSAQYLYFEISGRNLAISLNDLSAAAGSCPFIQYVGLPKGISGVVQFSGKILPVLDWQSIFSDSKSNSGNSFHLNSTQNLYGSFVFSMNQSANKKNIQDIAIPIPADVLVASGKEVENNQVQDPEGKVSDLISIQNLINQLNYFQQLQN